MVGSLQLGYGINWCGTDCAVPKTTESVDASTREPALSGFQFAKKEAESCHG